MRKTGITGEVIKMYENAGLDVNTIYAKSQLLLCSYRRICWSVQNDAYYLMDESCHYGEDYTAALAYLMECNLVRRTEKGRLRRRGWGLRWEKAQKGGKGTNLRGFFED